MTCDISTIDCKLQTATSTAAKNQLCSVLLHKKSEEHENKKVVHNERKQNTETQYLKVNALQTVFAVLRKCAASVFTRLKLSVHVK